MTTTTNSPQTVAANDAAVTMMTGLDWATAMNMGTVPGLDGPRRPAVVACRADRGWADEIVGHTEVTGSQRLVRPPAVKVLPLSVPRRISPASSAALAAWMWEDAA